jgi:hypothetical protein
VLTCDVVVSNIALGRIPLMGLELPADVTLPPKPEDRLLLNLPLSARHPDCQGGPSPSGFFDFCSSERIADATNRSAPFA